MTIIKRKVSFILEKKKEKKKKKKKNNTIFPSFNKFNLSHNSMHPLELCLIFIFYFVFVFVGNKKSRWMMVIQERIHKKDNGLLLNTQSFSLFLLFLSLFFPSLFFSFQIYDRIFFLIYLLDKKFLKERKDSNADENTPSTPSLTSSTDGTPKGEVCIFSSPFHHLFPFFPFSLFPFFPLSLFLSFSLSLFPSFPLSLSPSLPPFLPFPFLSPSTPPPPPGHGYFYV